MRWRWRPAHCSWPLQDDSVLRSASRSFCRDLTRAQYGPALGSSGGGTWHDNRDTNGNKDRHNDDDDDEDGGSGDGKGSRGWRFPQHLPRMERIFRGAERDLLGQQQQQQQPLGELSSSLASLPFSHGVSAIMRGVMAMDGSSTNTTIPADQQHLFDWDAGHGDGDADDGWGGGGKAAAVDGRA